jgi:hypothetical protein
MEASTRQGIGNSNVSHKQYTAKTPVEGKKCGADDKYDLSSNSTQR